MECRPKKWIGISLDASRGNSPTHRHSMNRSALSMASLMDTFSIYGTRATGACGANSAGVWDKQGLIRWKSPSTANLVCPMTSMDCGCRRTKPPCDQRPIEPTRPLSQINHDWRALTCHWRILGGRTLAKRQTCFKDVGVAWLCPRS